MLTLDTSDAPLFRVTVADEVTDKEVRDFYAAFKPALDDQDRVGLLVDMTAFTDIGARALLDDIVNEFSLLGKMSKMPRVAVVTGNRMIGGMIHYLAPLVPRMHVRDFDPTELTEAEAWARDLPEPKSKGDGLKMIDSESDDVLAFELDGYIDDDHIDEIIEPFRARIDKGGRFNALARLKQFRGFDPELMVNRSLMGMKWDAIHAVDRYAIVTDSNWIRPVAGMARMFSKVDVRIFPTAEEAAAWEWVRQPAREVAA